MQHRILRGIHCIRVKGNCTERARAHSALLRKSITQGSLPALARKNEWMIRRGPGLLGYGPVQDVAVNLYRNFILPVLGANSTVQEKEMLRVAALETGLPFELFRESYFQADALLLLARTSLMKHYLPEWLASGLPACTSAVALKNWTQDGHLLACRNLDYPIVGPWEKFATAVFNEPTEPNEIPYLNITSAGVHPAGVTSMNREGLTLATHAHFGKKVSLQGKAIVGIGDEVIRKCKTLGQAVDLVKKRTRCANWAFVISSAKENEAVVVEMNPHDIHVRSTEDGYLTHTNFFHGKDLQKDEALLSGSYCEDLLARMNRLRSLLEPHRGKLEPHHMSVALGDHIDPLNGEERVFGNILSVVTTVTSVVFQPGNQRLWMAARDESPVGLGDYVELNLDRFWTESSEDYERSMSVLPSYQPKNPNLVEAVRHYRNAFCAHHMENHQPEFEKKTLASLKKALKVYPSDGHLWVQAGLVAFKCHQFKEARRYLEESRSRSLSKHVGLVRDLYLARCLDFLGHRDQAMALYRGGCDAQEPKLRRAFKTGLKRKFCHKDVSKVMINLQFPDTFHYH